MIATSSPQRVAAAFLATTLFALGGCACSDCHQGCGPGHGGYFGFAPPVCFGYSSTCWHAWPAECVGCPPFTYPPQQAVEAMPKTPPPPAPSLPHFESTPVPEPSPSDETPRPSQGSRRREAPPVVKIDPQPTLAPEPEPVAFEPAPASPVESAPTVEAAPPAEPLKPEVESMPSQVASAESNEPKLAQPVETPAPSPTVASRAEKRPWLALPALFQHMHTPRTVAAASPRTGVLAEPNASTDEAAPVAEFGPPAPVLIEPPAHETPSKPTIEITRFEQPQPTDQTPGMIFNPAVPAAYTPPPVLVEARPELFSAPRVPPVLTEEPASERQPSLASDQPPPSHIIADFQGDESFAAPVVQPSRFRPAPTNAEAEPTETLAPIVSPSAVRRPTSPVRFR